MEFKNYYLLKPSIKFIDQNVNYLISKNKEKGKNVKDNFEYSSSNNLKFLNISEIKKYIDNEFK
jgi:UDP-N-acetylglucosamine 4,6-dehydratase